MTVEKDYDREQYSNLMKPVTKMVAGVFCAKKNGSLRVEYFGRNHAGGGLIQIGSEDNRSIGVDKESCEVLSRFFADLATDLSNLN